MTGVIATIPRFQFSNAQGDPLASGMLSTYLAGTTAPATTYQDQALTIENTNPVRLDARGECVLWLDPAKSYKFVLKNALGVTQWTQDNVVGALASNRERPVETELQTAGEGQKLFTLKKLTYTPGIGSLKAYVDGFRLSGAEYVETAQDAVTFKTGLREGQEVLFETGSGINNLTASDAALIPYTPQGLATTNVAQALDAIREKQAEEVSVLNYYLAGETYQTGMIQRAIDAVYAAGGGAVTLPDGDYLIEPSQTGEVFDNYGAAWNAVDIGIILRKNVSLLGTGSARCRLIATSTALSVLCPVSIENATIAGIEIDGGWSDGESGAGHGIFTLAGAGGADAVCKNLTVRDVAIKNVASYGLALQCGVPQGVTLDRVHVENTGADAFDLKARSLIDTTSDAVGNKAINISIRNHGQRVQGSAGMDVRGVWTINNVQVVDYGATPGHTQCGIRFRTKPAPGDGNRVGSKSSLSNFYVRPALGADPTGHYGIESGSDDVHISNGTIERCQGGVILVGNSNGGTLRNTLVNVTALDCAEYGFETSASTTEATFIGCNSKGAGVAGFRDTGTNTRYVACRSIADASPISTSSGAGPSQTIIGCDFGNERGVSITSPVAGRVLVEPRGDSANIELRLEGKGAGTVSMHVNGGRAFATDNPANAVNYVLAKGAASGGVVQMLAQGPDASVDMLLGGKGAGVLRFGTHSLNADAPITGYITIKDSGGIVRKLAVIA